MKKLFLPVPSPAYRIHLNKNVNRMDPSKPVETMTTDDFMNQMEDFPKDYFPMEAKKYSIPAHIYKHVYVTSPSKYKKDKKKKPSRKEESWLDFLNPFGCESDYEDYDEDYSGSDEYLINRKTKLKYKKKKKKLLLKILLGAIIFIVAKVALHKLSYLFPTFFPTTGRDEIDPDNDQLFHDGIELERANYYSGAQEISMQHRSFFQPNYDETSAKFN